MKLSKILSKRVLSLLIVGLFVFTAFAVIQSGGTNPASIHSVSPTSNLPYTTTSNGLTYTVESNGTYLWNGHYLRDPPVPYPTVPTIAPDGLPYGAVGKIGAQGQVGAKSFPKGTAQMIGVSPNTTVGGDTIIDTNTFWGNESITLVGNVTVSGGSLTIYNSNITFDETANGTAYEYGIATQNAEPLYIRHGTVMKISSPSTENGFFVYANNYNGNGAVIEVMNTTIYENSTSNVAPQPGGTFYDSLPVVFDPTKMSYSTYIGNNKENEALSQGIYSPGTTPDEQYFVNHSLIEYGIVQALSPSNDTFTDNSTFHWSANSPGTYALSYDTFSSTLNMSYQSSIAQGSASIRNTIFSSLVFYWTSTSAATGGFLYSFNDGNIVASNDTFSNITIYSAANAGITTFAVFFGQSLNASFTHIMIGKFQTGGGGPNSVTSAFLYVAPPIVSGNYTPMFNYVNFTYSSV